MAARGDMFAGRTRGNRLFKVIASLLFRLPEEDHFEPDLLVDEGTDLSRYGLEGARVLLLGATRPAPSRFCWPTEASFRVTS